MLARDTVSVPFHVPAKAGSSGNDGDGGEDELHPQIRSTPTEIALSCGAKAPSFPRRTVNSLESCRG